MEKHSTQVVEAARATLAKASNDRGGLFPDRSHTGTGLDKPSGNEDAEKTLSGRYKVEGREQPKAPIGSAKRGGLNGSPASEVHDTRDPVSDFDLDNAGNTVYKMLLKQDDHGNYLSDGKGNTHASVQERVQAQIARMAAKPTGDGLDSGDTDDDRLYEHCRSAAESMSQAAMTEGDERHSHLVRALGHMAHACRLHEAMSKKA